MVQIKLPLNESRFSSTSGLEISIESYKVDFKICSTWPENLPFAGAVNDSAMSMDMFLSRHNLKTLQILLHKLLKYSYSARLLSLVGGLKQNTNMKINSM